MLPDNPLLDSILGFLLGAIAMNIVWLLHDRHELKKLDKTLTNPS